MAALKPPRDVARRHTAAMEIIDFVDPEERVQLLAYVLLGSPEIDKALAERDKAFGIRAEERERSEVTV